jgi:hypothetical protein
MKQNTCIILLTTILFQVSVKLIGISVKGRWVSEWNNYLSYKFIMALHGLIRLYPMDILDKTLQRPRIPPLPFLEDRLLIFHHPLAIPNEIKELKFCTLGMGDGTLNPKQYNANNKFNYDTISNLTSMAIK